MDPFFSNQEDEMIQLLKTIVEMETPSSNKIAVDKLGAFFSQLLQNLGGEVTIHENLTTGNHILASFGSGPKSILLLHHMDTVFPIGTLAEMPFRQDQFKTYGPGVLDMKGGIIISYLALRYLIETHQMTNKVLFLITSDEEVGSQTSENLIIELAKTVDLALVLESGLVNGALKNWRKGVGDYILEAFGKASHAGGAHQEGINAIEEMAHQLIKIQKMTNYDLGTTLNIGTIHGGTVPNVVPEYCRVEIDFRVLRSDEAERVDIALRSLKPVLQGTRIHITGGLNRPPMPFNDIMESTFLKAQQIAKTINQELITGGSGGGSDGNLIAPFGVPIIDGIGAYGEGLHSNREYIFTKSISERAELVAAILKQW